MQFQVQLAPPNWQLSGTIGFHTRRCRIEVLVGAVEYNLTKAINVLNKTQTLYHFISWSSTTIAMAIQKEHVGGGIWSLVARAACQNIRNICVAVVRVCNTEPASSLLIHNIQISTNSQYKRTCGWKMRDE